MYAFVLFFFAAAALGCRRRALVVVPIHNVKEHAAPGGNKGEKGPPGPKQYIEQI